MRCSKLLFNVNESTVHNLCSVNNSAGGENVASTNHAASLNFGANNSASGKYGILASKNSA